MEPLDQWVLLQISTTLLLYFMKNAGAYMRQQVDSCQIDSVSHLVEADPAPSAPLPRPILLLTLVIFDEAPSQAAPHSPGGFGLLPDRPVL